MEGYILVSVFHKTEELVDFLKKVEPYFKGIISSRGTADFLEERGFAVTRVGEITGFPESFDGRVKTINPKIASGILFDRKNPEHVKQAKELKILPIDMVVCDPYDLESSVGKDSLYKVFDNIDIGGPMAAAAAAKNCWNVTVIIDQADYRVVAEELVKHGSIHVDLRRKLAEKAFRFIGQYYTQAADYLKEVMDN